MTKVKTIMFNATKKNSSEYVATPIAR